VTRHCPKCRGFVRREPAAVMCANCGWSFIIDGLSRDAYRRQSDIDHALAHYYRDEMSNEKAQPSKRS